MTNPNIATLSPSPSSPRRMTGWGLGVRPRLPLILALILLLTGGVIVSYPFWPGIKYALARPTPVLPYKTALSGTSNLTSLHLPSLPVVSNKPVPKDNRLVIPSIGVDMPIYEGATQKTLDRGGLWHIPNTSDPVLAGNMVLSGHRWQYRPPSSTTLYLLDKVKVGEPMVLYWHGQEYDYTITAEDIVNPDRVDILNNTDQPQLTIFTCTPLFSIKQRLVIYGKLIS